MIDKHFQRSHLKQRDIRGFLGDIKDSKMLTNIREKQTCKRRVKIKSSENYTKILNYFKSTKIKDNPDVGESELDTSQLIKEPLPRQT